MARKETFIKNIFTDDTLNQEFLYDLKGDEWTQGVVDTLQLLYNWRPCATSKQILDGITASGKTVTFIPSHSRGFGPDKIGANAYTIPVEWKRTPAGGWTWVKNFTKGTAPGKPTEDEDDPQPGVGGGSDSLIEFVAQDFDPVDSASISFKVVDEALLHELVHALRQTLGQEDNSDLPPPTPTMGLGNVSLSDLRAGQFPPPTTTTQIYQNLEEFAAILITNIYRSENQRMGLIRDHLGPKPRRGEPQGTPEKPFQDRYETTRTLGGLLTNPRNFLTFWRPQITRLFTELSRNAIIHGIEIVGPNVGCSFNPFWELMLERTRRQPAAYAH
jgi:hypothetical protein